MPCGTFAENQTFDLIARTLLLLVVAGVVSGCGVKMRRPTSLVKPAEVAQLALKDVNVGTVSGAGGQTDSSNFSLRAANVGGPILKKKTTTASFQLMGGVKIGH